MDSPEKSQELEKYVSRQLSPTHSKSTDLQAIATVATPSASAYSCSASTECAADEANRKFCELSNSLVICHNVDSTRTVSSSGINSGINIVDCDHNNILPPFEWHRSVIASRSFTIVRCASKQQQNEVMKILQTKQSEELEAVKDTVITPKLNTDKLRLYLLDDEKKEERTSGQWYVTECCCTEDKPHRVKDKFVLVQGRTASMHMLVQSQSLVLPTAMDNNQSQRPPPLMRSDGAQTVPTGMAMSIPMSSMNEKQSPPQLQLSGDLTPMHMEMPSMDMSTADMAAMYSASVDFDIN